MAKKDKKKSKKDNKPAEAVGAVRTAVERTFQATADSAQSTRTRAQDLVDEVAGAAGRVREMIEDIRVLEDLKRLRTEVETLTRRVAALEDKPAPAKPAPPQPQAPATALDRQEARIVTDREGGRHGALDREITLARRPSRASTAAKSRSTAAKSRSTAAKPRSSAAQEAAPRAAKKPAAS